MYGLPEHNWRNGRIQGTMVTVAALCDPEGGLLEGASQRHSPATQPDQPEWNLPTWEDIVRTHSARVYRLAYRLTGNPHDAEDLTQEVFVRVFRSLSSYTPGTFEGWLHRITTNLFLDSARRKQRIRFEGLADEMAHRLAGSEPTPAEAFDDSHLDDDVQAALKALPPEYRAAVVLCDIEGFSYEEIAATLGVKLGTVRSRIHRGRAQLRAALGHRRPSPVTPGAVAPGPVTPGPVTPGPVTPGPVTPGPVTPGPVAPGPVAPGPVAPGPVGPGTLAPGPGSTTAAEAGW
jgi:RNA polymerase sigma-70 factor (ECF subfamily)